MVSTPWVTQCICNIFVAIQQMFYIARDSVPQAIEGCATIGCFLGKNRINLNASNILEIMSINV